MINLPARCGLKTKRLVVELAEQFERRRGADRERRQADPGAHPIDDPDPRGFHRRRCPRFEPQAKKAPPAAGLESLFAARETDGSKRRQ